MSSRLRSCRWPNRVVFLSHIPSTYIPGNPPSRFTALLKAGDAVHLPEHFTHSAPGSIEAANVLLGEHSCTTQHCPAHLFQQRLLCCCQRCHKLRWQVGRHLLRLPCQTCVLLHVGQAIQPQYTIHRGHQQDAAGGHIGLLLVGGMGDGILHKGAQSQDCMTAGCLQLLQAGQEQLPPRQHRQHSCTSTSYHLLQPAKSLVCYSVTCSHRLSASYAVSNGTPGSCTHLVAVVYCRANDKVLASLNCGHRRH